MRLFLNSIWTFILLISSSIIMGQKVGTFLVDPEVNMEAITWSPTGKIFVLDFQAGSVYRVDGDSLKLLGTGFGTVSGGGLDIQGNFYFSAHLKGEIYKVDHNDSISLFSSGLSGPVGILLSNDATFFYVVDFDNNSVKKVKLSDGSINDFVSGNGLRGPDGIVRMTNGDLLVSNFTNNQIHRITPSGDVSYFGSHSKYGNMGYIAKAKRFYYVTSMSGNTIDRFNEIGERISYTGTGEAGYVDGDISIAAFNRPRGITSSPSGDTLLITEKGGRIRYITDLKEYPPTTSYTTSSYFKVYPNPTFGNIVVKYACEESCPEVRIDVLDFTGKRFLSQTANTFKRKLNLNLNLAKFPPGVYYLRLLQNQNEVEFKKLVIVDE